VSTRNEENVAVVIFKDTEKTTAPQKKKEEEIQLYDDMNSTAVSYLQQACDGAGNKIAMQIIKD
jgi:hypothetical protein